jgi:hypothetical protein
VPDQVMADNSVKVTTVHNIVDMAIVVIVLSPCLNGQEVP